MSILEKRIVHLSYLDRDITWAVMMIIGATFIAISLLAGVALLSANAQGNQSIYVESITQSS